MANKNKKDVPKGHIKRVLHIILPTSVWEKLDRYQIKHGFTTRVEAVRHLIRTAE